MKKKTERLPGKRTVKEKKTMEYDEEYSIKPRKEIRERTCRIKNGEEDRKTKRSKGM